MGVSIICCKCQGRFDERELRGSWLNRHCPLCGKQLSERAYDEAARTVLAESGGATDDFSPGRNQRGRRRDKQAQRLLDDLALARYYTSEWFRLACAGKGSDAPDKGLFGLGVSYDAEGVFRLAPADDDRSPDGGWGVSAEFLVFDALRAEIARKKSPLASARLLPSLVFPWLPGMKPKQWGAKCRAEMDCVLLGESFAVVVEVKRRTHNVRASGDFKRISEQAIGAKSWRTSDVREQIVNCAEAFEERQQLYPHERIFKLVVFVDAASFECKTREFRNGWLVSCLDDAGGAPFVAALRTQAKQLEPLAGKRQVQELASRLMDEFGNTSERRAGRIVRGQAPGGSSRQRLTDGMLADIASRTEKPKSPLHGARLLTYPVCEVDMAKRRKGAGGKSQENTPAKTKQVHLAGLLLTRSHALFIDTRPWPVHVNTHSPFATVYTGDPAKGAKHVEDAIRHDWDLREIHYENRSGSLTLLTYLAKSVTDVECYQERNRVYTMNVFLNPASFYTDREEFKQRTFIGFWRKRSNNIITALEQLEREATPILSQQELDALADQLAAIE